MGEPECGLVSNGLIDGSFHDVLSPRRDIAQVLNRLSTDVTSYLSQRRRCIPERFLDLQYRDLTSDPPGVVRRIYERFDLVLSAEAEKRLQVFLAKDRQKKRAHHYSPWGFGLDPQLIQKSFQEYLDVFSIESEG